MTSRANSTELNQAVEMILTQGVEGLNKAFKVLYNEAMKVERSRYLQAEPYQRTDERIDYANGYKPKQLHSRLGKLALLIPQMRSHTALNQWKDYREIALNDHRRRINKNLICPHALA